MKIIQVIMNDIINMVTLHYTGRFLPFFVPLIWAWATFTLIFCMRKKTKEVFIEASKQSLVVGEKTMTGRFYRSRTSKVLAGICGGLGDYFNFDPVLARMGYAAFTIITGIMPGILFYLICIFIIPLEPVEEN